MKKFIVGLAFLFAAAYASTQVENWPVLLSRINTWTALQTFSGGEVAAYVTGGYTVTITPQAGAGTSATATCQGGWNCSNISGLVQLHTGTASTASGNQVLVSWSSNGSFPNNPTCFVQSYGSGGAWTPLMVISGKNGFYITSGSALTVSTIYYALYWCGGN